MTEKIKKGGGCWMWVLGITCAIGLLFTLGRALLGDLQNMLIRNVTAECGTYKSALDMYQQNVETKSYPGTLQQLVSDNCAGWGGPYMAYINKDPWGNNYLYQSDGVDYTITSIHYSFPLQIFEQQSISYNRSADTISVR